ncbi:MAG: anti-sigma factor domain-containing protein [Candidatus Limnocylindrales bacterium]
MAITCDRVRELAAGFVLGALEPGEMADVRAHMERCVEPHPELAELGGILPYLAVAPQPLEPPAWLRGSVLAAVKADLQARQPVGATAERRVIEPATAAQATAAASRPGAGIISLEVARRSRSRRAATWMTRMAAAVAVVALAGYSFAIQGDLNKAKQDQSHAIAVLNVLGEPNTKMVSLIDTEGKGASGFAAFMPNGHVIVSLNHVAATSGDQTYMVWLTGANNVPVKVGAFTVGDDGKGWVEVTSVPTSPSMWIWVCREPNSKVTLPTGPTILSGTVAL